MQPPCQVRESWQESCGSVAVVSGEKWVKPSWVRVFPLGESW